MNLTPSKFDVPLLGGLIAGQEALIRLGEENSLMSLPCGHRFTSIDRNPSGTRLIAGDTYGMVHLLDHKMKSRRLNQGAAVLDVRFTNESDFVSTDTAKKWLLWRPPYNRPYELPFEGNAPISSQVMAGNTLVGFSADGCVALWASKGSTTIRCAGDVRPPVPYSLAKGLYWTAAKKAVFPVAGGGLLCVDTVKQTTELHSVHAGDYYALFEWNETLATVGSLDGLVKCWGSNPFHLVSELESPLRVIAAGLTLDHRAPLLLVQQDGTAHSFQVNEREITPVGAPFTGEFHVICGVSYSTYVTTTCQARNAEARRCAVDVAKAISDRNARRAESLMDSYRGVFSESLRSALYADIAGLNGDIHRQAQLRQDVIRTLPHTTAAIPSYWRQAHFFMRHMHFAAALDALQSLSYIDHGEEVQMALEHVSTMANLSANEAALIRMDEDTALEHIQVAAALAQPVRPRMLFHEWDVTDCWGTQFDASECLRAIVGCHESYDIGLTYKNETLRVITPDAIGTPEECMVISRPLGEGHRLELVYRFKQENGRTDVVPGLSFAPAQLVHNVAEHNQTLERFIRGVLHGHEYVQWQRSVQHQVEKALGTVVNQKLAQKDRQ
ncbi:MAG: hypothetical protein AMXMBFR84_47380 [Candidatus Hydrogenedentota bacterium]